MDNMDNKDIKNGNPEGCQCGWCTWRRGGWGCGGRWSWLRLLIGIVILIFVFWAGFKLGELKGSLEGYGWYGGNGRHSPGYMMGPGMMGWRYYNGAVPQATGTVPTGK